MNVNLTLVCTVIYFVLILSCSVIGILYGKQIEPKNKKKYLYFYIYYCIMISIVYFIMLNQVYSENSINNIGMLSLFNIVQIGVVLSNKLNRKIIYSTYIVSSIYILGLFYVLSIHLNRTTNIPFREIFIKYIFIQALVIGISILFFIIFKYTIPYLATRSERKRIEKEKTSNEVGRYF